MTAVAIITITIAAVIFIIVKAIKLATSIIRHIIRRQRDFITGQMPKDEEEPFIKKFCLFSMLSYWMWWK